MQGFLISTNLAVWMMVALWFMPKLTRRSRCSIMIKEAGKYCVFAERFVNIMEIIYLNDMDVKEILLCWDRLCAVLNQHNYQYDHDRYYSYIDLEPILSERYSDDCLTCYFEKKAVARFLKNKKVGEKK